MKKKSIKVNAILNVIKVILSVIFPLITYPYASRILMAENLGKVSFSSSFISYFSLLATLGITTYAIREGSKIRDDKTKINKFSNEIFSINIITTIISYLLLLVTVILFYRLKQYKYLIMIYSISIIFSTLGIDWINSIYEDYLYITIRSLIINIISLICLFTFVKTANDYYIYAILTVISNAMICICNYIYCKKYIDLKFTFQNNFKKHIKKMLVFFANNVAVSIYVNADITMIGIISNNYSVGIYTVAVKVYSILKNIFAAIYLVTIPQLTTLYLNKEIDKFRKMATQITSTIILLLLPCSAGLIILSKDIILILSGNEFIKAYKSLSILGVALIFALLGGIITQCINVSLNREKITLKATIISSMSNILLNLFFIRYWKEVGAAITTAISELIVLVYCLYCFKDFKKYVDLENIFKTIKIAAFGMIFIFLIGIIINNIATNIIIRMFLIIFFSVLWYMVLLIFTKNEILLSILNKLLKKGEK